jgi:hypothetical protein
VRRARISDVAGAAEDYRLPKGIHLRQVRVPVDLRHFVEDKPEKIVRADLRVESIYEAFDIGATREVGAACCRGIEIIEALCLPRV